jgi:hypothetical protein
LTFVLRNIGETGGVIQCIFKGWHERDSMF